MRHTGSSPEGWGFGWGWGSLEKNGKPVNKYISERGKCYQENKTRTNYNAIIIRGRDPRKYYGTKQGAK